MLANTVNAVTTTGTVLKLKVSRVVWKSKQNTLVFGVSWGALNLTVGIEFDNH